MQTQLKVRKKWNIFLRPEKGECFPVNSQGEKGWSEPFVGNYDQAMAEGSRRKAVFERYHLGEPIDSVYFKEIENQTEIVDGKAAASGDGE